ncbi:hypothetical protein XHV734_p0065 (plasmid) [Xanthomonas hortorum pv. vitians]|nr:hypothetical protein XHV734_p0065 [Xanthomonas hortorum pv. vitians]
MATSSSLGVESIIFEEKLTFMSDISSIFILIDIYRESRQRIEHKSVIAENVLAIYALWSSHSDHNNGWPFGFCLAYS